MVVDISHHSIIDKYWYSIRSKVRVEESLEAPWRMAQLLEDKWIYPCSAITALSI